MQNNKTTKAVNGASAASFIPAVGIVLLPKLACAACWPAYAAVLSATGVGFALFASSYRAFPWRVAVFFGWGATKRRGYGPLITGGVAGAGLVVGKFWQMSSPLFYAATAAFIVSSVWNAWPKAAAKACENCNEVSNA